MGMAWCYSTRFFSYYTYARLWQGSVGVEYEAVLDPVPDGNHQRLVFYTDISDDREVVSPVGSAKAIFEDHGPWFRGLSSSLVALHSWSLRHVRMIARAFVGSSFLFGSSRACRLRPWGAETQDRGTKLWGNLYGHILPSLASLELYFNLEVTWYNSGHLYFLRDILIFNIFWREGYFGSAMMNNGLC